MNYYRDHSESLQMPGLGDVPGGPVVSTQCFPCWCPTLFPDQGTKIPQIVWHDQRGKKKKPVIGYKANAYCIGIFTSYERLLIFQRISIVLKIQLICNINEWSSKIFCSKQQTSKKATKPKNWKQKKVTGFYVLKGTELAFITVHSSSLNLRGTEKLLLKIIKTE